MKLLRSGLLCLIVSGSLGLISCSSPRAGIQAGKVVSLSTDENRAVFRIKAEPGKQYQLQKKESLSEPNWKNLGDPVTASGDTVQISDESATNSTAFYRIIPLN